MEKKSFSLFQLQLRGSFIRNQSSFLLLNHWGGLHLAVHLIAGVSPASVTDKSEAGL